MRSGHSFHDQLVEHDGGYRQAVILHLPKLLLEFMLGSATEFFKPVASPEHCACLGCALWLMLSYQFKNAE
jgi:hypothetical protein